MSRSGVLCSLASSVLFGLGYYLNTFVHGVGAGQVTAWRVLVTAVVLTAVILLMGRRAALAELISQLRRSPRVAAALVTSSVLVGFQLWLFTWAPVNGRSLEVTLGYFLLPLCMVFVGRAFLGERLDRWRWAAVLAAAVGVVASVAVDRRFDWSTAAVAVGYSAYFLVHRRYGLDRLEAFQAEVVLLAAPALWLVGTGYHSRVEPSVIVALVAVTVVGAFAMALYIAASASLPFGLFGLLGYAQPVLLLIASLVAGERIRPVDALTYGPILIALTLLGVGTVRAGQSKSTDDDLAQYVRSSGQVQESWENT